MESFTTQHNKFASQEIFQNVFSYPVVKIYDPINEQKLKDGQRFLDKDEVLYDENGRPITPRRTPRSSRKTTPKSKQRITNAQTQEVDDYWTMPAEIVS